MRVLVQKFGGTSLASAQSRGLAADKILTARREGLNPAVVVSAMGRRGQSYATDTLIDLARAANQNIAARELDQIMCCGEMISAVVMAGVLQAAGAAAVMLTGGQAGIVTDGSFNNARILKVDTRNITALLAQGKIPVVCGFQGVTDGGEMTTLGRGGSDTTAAALGAALNAEKVEIYTDVDGIMTADPRIVADARILDCISYGEVCQLAHQGAKVIHPRAVEIAMQKNIPLVVKSTFSEAPGTLIANFDTGDGGAAPPLLDRIATGVTYLSPIAQLEVAAAQPSAGYKIFQAMAAADISVDLINVYPGRVMFTVAQDALEAAAEQLRRLDYKVNTIGHCAKVSVVGGGMREVPGVMASFAEALNEQNVTILQTVDSHTSISALVKQADLAKSVAALHDKFNLAK